MSSYPANFFSALLENAEASPSHNDSGESSLLLADELLSILPTARAEMIRLYYRDGLSFRKIGAVYGLTHERIRQIIISGFRKIRLNLTAVYGEWPLEESLTYSSYLAARYRAKHLTADSPLTALTRLGLAPGILSRMHAVGVHTVGEFLQLGEEKLTGVDGVGKVRAKKLLDLQETVRGKLG